jgi:hypothetical protein
VTGLSQCSFIVDTYVKATIREGGGVDRCLARVNIRSRATVRVRAKDRVRTTERAIGLGCLDWTTALMNNTGM